MRKLVTCRPRNKPSQTTIRTTARMRNIAVLSYETEMIPGREPDGRGTGSVCYEREKRRIVAWRAKES
jgi:hypothetical protein